MKKYNNKKGFTLVELIVVMAVIGILVLLAMPKFMGYTKKAHLTEIKSNIKQLENASERYYIDKQKWPRLGDTPYTAEQIETFAQEILNKTGEIVTIDPDGSYYEIDYRQLQKYVQEPKDGIHYILQNPVGEVYWLKNLTDEGKKELGKSSGSSDDEKPGDIPEKIEDITTLGELQKFPQTTNKSTPDNAGTDFITFTDAQKRFNNYLGGWNNIGTGTPYSSNIGSSVEIPFDGTGVDIEFMTEGGYSLDIEIYVDGARYPNISTNFGNWNLYYFPIARNLPDGEHVVKLVNKASGPMRPCTVRVYKTPTEVSNLTINTSTTNLINTLKINMAPMEKYVVYRSKSPNININTAYAFDIIDGDDIPAVYRKSNTVFEYQDTTHTFEKYYYKIVGIDAGGYRWVSNEVSISHPETVTYNNTIANNRLTFKNFIGSWEGKNTSNPYGRLDSSVEIPFIGTGVDIMFMAQGGYSSDIELYVDGVRYPNVSTNFGNWLDYYYPTVRNLPHGEHVIKLINKTTGVMRISGIKSYTTPVTPSSLTVSTDTLNYINTLKINFAPVEKYIVYRSKNPNINISTAQVFDTIDSNDIPTIYRNTASTFSYQDKTHTFETYYYKVVGIDAGKNKWISNEVSIVYPEKVTYNNAIANDRLKFKNFTGTWYDPTGANPYGTSVDGSVEIPFIGTGVDIEFMLNSGYSSLVEVYVDGELCKTVSPNIAPSTKEIIRGLPHGEHVVKLVNKTTLPMRPISVTAYTK